MIDLNVFQNLVESETNNTHLGLFKDEPFNDSDIDLDSPSPLKPL